ncbi:hypothetical protein COHA_009586 [Chlorella ohadii]|uniref:Uncharacterized protein n=1 Tax=Chlorella ohadii TaxID=2649997 RepID=A0AAD5GY02_9CHLO|nr:hypothetical protein COHA_009586 [Chlorella ohadii]
MHDHRFLSLRQCLQPLQPLGLTKPPQCRRQQLRTTAGAGEAGAAGSPSSGLDALHDAVERGDLRGVQAAIEQLQHPEQELDTLVVRGNGIPQAAIHRAAQGGKETCMKVLMLSGADRDLRDGAGRTPIALAAAAGQEECVEVLLSGGVDKSAADAQQRTPLHAAAAAGQERCARQLLNARVAADPRDCNTQTPLHLAATVGSVPCVRALLAYGADAAATDSAGSTARALAALSGHRAAELYLLAVESTAAASPGHPTRAELLAGQDQQLDGIYRLACSAKDEAAQQELEREVRQLVQQQGQAGRFL